MCRPITALIFNNNAERAGVKKGKHGLVKLLIKDNVLMVAENGCALCFLLRKAGVEPATHVLTRSRGLVKSEWSVVPAREEAITCSKQL